MIKNFWLLQNVRPVCGAHPAYYSKDTGGGGFLFPGNEAAEGASMSTHSWSLTSVPPHALLVLRCIRHSDVIAIYLRCITICVVYPVSFRIKFQMG